ncbi:MAG: DoxX family protein [Saprospiraceae bacterium]|nr:DoxX family protein [Saprospiraceae bacterium]
MKSFWSALPFPSFHAGYALLRISIGALIFYHGIEVFYPETMESYGKWFTELGFPQPLPLAYLGKWLEVFVGLSLMLGLLTRLGALGLIACMAFIGFGIGKGRFWYEDQHPFLFLLFGVLFVWGGAGKWSVDERVFKSR